MPILIPSDTPEKERDRWATPPELFKYADDKYGAFHIDAAADETNHKCDTWLGGGSPLGLTNALAVEWNSWALLTPIHPARLRVWCNPPYSLPGPFVRHAAKAAHLYGTQTTLLLPSTTDVRWWHRDVWNGAANRFRRGVEVEFLPQRVKHIRPDGTRGAAPTFGSVLVTFYG